MFCVKKKENFNILLVLLQCPSVNPRNNLQASSMDACVSYTVSKRAWDRVQKHFNVVTEAPGSTRVLWQTLECNTIKTRPSHDQEGSGRERKSLWCSKVQN